MPNKYLNKKGIEIKTQRYKITNWAEYNEALCQRGRIDVWLSQEAIDQWYEKDRTFTGEGTPQLYTDLAIITCHEIRQVFKLPLRQTEGFINSLFDILNLSLRCPDYSTLSIRLKQLGIKSPRYKKTDRPDEDLMAIAIDSTGLKRYGRGEWHQEKHKVSAKRSWRKLHIGVDNKHIIHASVMTDRFVNDDQVVEDLLNQIDCPVDQFTGDGAYDKNPVYELLSKHSATAEIIIPPDSDAKYDVNKNHVQRSQNTFECQAYGRMSWQRQRHYGNRNYSELAMKRYKEILGNKLYARDIDRQKQETMIGCGVLNKMTNLGMPQSHRVT